MNQITPETTIGELCGYEEFKPLSEYFFTNMTEDVWNRPLDYYGFEKCGFAETLEWVKALILTGQTLTYPVYQRDTDKESVKLIFMPPEPSMSPEPPISPVPPNHTSGKPYVLICPGGAYARQWGLIEGLAMGARMNRLGYPAFVLYYRTAQTPPFDRPLMPKPIEDLAAAIRLIEDRAEGFGVRAGDYAVAGFSAGAHLAAEWGTVNHGFAGYGLKGPAALLLGYPSISTDLFLDMAEEARRNKQEADVSYLRRLGGRSFTRESLREYSIDYHMDRNYPPVYVTACKDDPIVPVGCSFCLIERLKELGIPYEANIAEHGGHRFGLGNGTEGDGWPEKDAGFWQQMMMGKAGTGK